MGIPGPKMLEELTAVVPCNNLKNKIVSAVTPNRSVYLIAPRSAYFLKPFIGENAKEEIRLDEVWSYSKHLNLDDLDFGDEGVWKTLGRVVGDRGLVVWRVGRECGN